MFRSGSRRRSATAASPPIRSTSEPAGPGFDFDAAFGVPTKVVNDAAMQALGSYEGGKMLFLGLGTGLGSALVERGRGAAPGARPPALPQEDLRGVRRRPRRSSATARRRWRKEVADVVAALTAALEPDYVVLGGGNAKKLKELPPRCRLGKNTNAFLGGFRIWDPDAPARIVS